MRPFVLGQKEWKKASVTARLDERSYVIKTPDGRLYRRNRRDLKKTPESIPIQSRSDHTAHKPSRQPLESEWSAKVTKRPPAPAKHQAGKPNNSAGNTTQGPERDERAEVNHTKTNQGKQGLDDKCYKLKDYVTKWTLHFTFVAPIVSV